MQSFATGLRNGRLRIYPSFLVRDFLCIMTDKKEVAIVNTLPELILLKDN